MYVNYVMHWRLTPSDRVQTRVSEWEIWENSRQIVNLICVYTRYVDKHPKDMKHEDDESQMCNIAMNNHLFFISCIFLSLSNDLH